MVWFGEPLDTVAACFAAASWACLAVAAASSSAWRRSSARLAASARCTASSSSNLSSRAVNASISAVALASIAARVSWFCWSKVCLAASTARFAARSSRTEENSSIDALDVFAATWARVSASTCSVGAATPLRIETPAEPAPTNRCSARSLIPADSEASFVPRASTSAWTSAMSSVSSASPASASASSWAA